MKKFAASIFALLFVLVMQSNVMAQQYYTYDGDTFSVLLTANSANTQIIKVEFSAEGEWHTFDIVDFSDLEETDEGGFLYTVLDGKGRKFTVDYYRNKDYIIVTDVEADGTWKLYRRDE